MRPRPPRALHAALLLALSAPLAGARQDAEPVVRPTVREAWETHFDAPPPPIPPEIRGATIDELIDALPERHPWMRLTTPDGGPGAPSSFVERELGRRIAAGAHLHDGQWTRALLRSGAIRYRERWPLTRPFTVEIRQPWWLPSAEIRLTTRSNPPRTVRGASGTPGACSYGHPRSFHHELGALPPWSREVTLDVDVGSWGRYGDPPRPVWSGPLHLPVQPVSSTRDCVPAADDANLERAVRESLRVSCAADHDRVPDCFPVLVLDPPADRRPLFDALALSLRLELLQGEEVVLSGRWIPDVVDPDSRDPWQTHGLGGVWFDPLQRALHGSTPEDLAVYTLRVTGTNSEVARLWDADRHWSGSLTIPASELRRRELAREDPDSIPVDWLVYEVDELRVRDD